MNIRSPWPWLAALAVVIWWIPISRLDSEWAINPQYSYGWAVPLLALYLGWNRWTSRPAPSPMTAPWIFVVLGVLAASMLPVRLVQEANGDWRLLHWILTFQACVLTLGLAFRIGGIPWLKHFAFPVLFLLVAVPWPTHPEKLFIQGLMQIVAAISTEALTWCGIPAIQRGNLIELGTGMVGIDEACSGVRSAQSTLMTTLFLGELYRFTIERRAILLVCGMLFAFAANIGRSFFLALMTSRKGVEFMESWHDPAGLTVLVISFGFLWLVAGRLAKGRDTHEVASTAPLPPPPSPVFLIGTAALLITGLVAIEAWYRFHTEAPLPGTVWSVNWPRDATGFKEVPVADSARALLRYDDVESFTWSTPTERWAAFFLHWKPGRNAAQLARGHRPDVCLPASGRTLNADLGIQAISSHGLSFPFRTFLFTDRNVPLHVFYCVWEDGTGGSDQAAWKEDWSWESRFKAAAQGRRDLGYRVLEVAIWGSPNAKSATESLQRHLDRYLIQ